MKRLGKYTGTVYGKGYRDIKMPPECCLQITDEQASDAEFVERKHLELFMSCINCRGCPDSWEADKATIPI